MTSATEEQISFKDVNKAIAALRAAEDADDYDYRLRLAGDWVVVHGTIYNHYTEPNLAAMQHCDAGNTAWSMVGHWSVQRGDGLEREPASFAAHKKSCATCAYLEGILALSSYLVHNRCETCGSDDTYDHVFGPRVDDDPKDPEGEIVYWEDPQVWCEEPWTKLDSLVEEPKVLSDEQVSEARTARWVAPLVDGNYALVFSSYYISYLPIAEPGLPVQLESGRWLVRYDYFVVCRDPDNYKATRVMDAEVWANVDSEDPEGEDLAELVDEAELEHGEFHERLPAAAAFRWK